MSVQRLIHFFDEKLTSLTLHVGVEQNVLLSFLFHGLFLSTHEMQSGAVDPQQGITVDMFRTLGGIADFDGRCQFMAPKNPGHVSHTILQRDSNGPAVEVPVRRLETILRTLGHSKIDVLKMDVEGAEYSVLADLLRSRIQVKQLLVEFHHRWLEIGVRKTKEAILALNHAGYKIFNV